jgi:hypothetical protein
MSHLQRIGFGRVLFSRFLSALLVLAGLSWGLGARAAPPALRDCDAVVPADRYNDRLDCRTENVNEALFEYVDAVIAFDRLGRTMFRGPIFSDSQTESLLAGRERAQSAKNRAHDAQAFRGAVRKQKSADEDCYVKEIIGDMGGPKGGDDVQPCEANEDCEEVIGDGIGDDDGICKMKGANREVCVQVCQQPLLTDDDNYDPNVAVDTEQGLDELELALRDATGEIATASILMRVAYAKIPAGRAPTDCELYQFDLFPGPASLQAAQVVKNASGAAFNGCSVGCNQDAFGWNCEAACLALAIVDGIANAVNDGFTVTDGNNGGAQLDRVARCTTQLDTQVRAISSTVDGNQASLDEVNVRLNEVSAQLEAITAQINALAGAMSLRFDHVDEQLCTPQGQRACFPSGQSGSGAQTHERQSATKATGVKRK